MSQEVPHSRYAKLRVFVLFIASVVVLDIVVRLTEHHLRMYNVDDYEVRVERGAESPRDLIILGGSPVSEGLNPELFHGVLFKGEVLKDAWSLALPGGTFTDSYFAFLYGATKPPKLLIIGVAATDFNDARNEPHGAYSIYNFDDVCDIGTTRPDARTWTVRRWAEGRLRNVSALYRQRHGLRLAAADCANDIDERICPETAALASREAGYAKLLAEGRGYAPAPWFAQANYAERKARGESFPPFEFLAKYRFGSHFRYLERLMAERGDTKVVLVEMPFTKDYETRFKAEIADFRARLQQWEAERGWTILRAEREALNLSDADFGDFVHLNRVGATKVSRWVAGRCAEVQP